MSSDSGGPLVSIGLSVYNEEANLVPALESLLAQSYRHTELIISDNASTDHTYAIASEFAQHDPRIRVVRNETNLGIVENFNRVFRLSRGEYFMWAAADDRWHPSFIARCLEVLQEDTSVVLAYPLTVRMDPDGVIHGELPRRQDTRGYELAHRFMLTVWGNVDGNRVYGLIRSQALGRTRLFRNVYYAERVLLAELSLLGPFAHVPELLYYRRMHDYGNRLPRRQWLIRSIPVPARWRVFYRLQILYEYIGVAWQVPLPFTRRIVLCIALVAGHAAIYGRNLFRSVPVVR